ncbi:MAG: glycosyltransferase family 4 protein [Christensenellaceae bacterium]
MMKIAFLAAANSPHTVKWANVFVQDNDVTVYSMPDHKDEQNEMSDKVKVVYLPYAQTQNGCKKNAAQLNSYLNAENFDVVNAIDAANYGYLAAKAKAAHVLLTVLGPDVYASVDYGKKGLILKSIKHANAVLAAAPNVITRVKSIFKKEKQYFVAPFGVDMEKFIHKEVPKDADKIVFGSIKPLEYVNRVDLTIDAFSKFLQQSVKDATLKIAGDGTLLAGLKQKAQDMGIADKIEFLGHIKTQDMPDVINSMDTTIQMGSAEAFGVCGVESMACGVAVISSDTVGASEYILNGVTGYLVKVNNTDAASTCMVELARGNDARIRMGQKARQDVEELFNIEKCKQKYDKALIAASK